MKNKEEYFHLAHNRGTHFGWILATGASKFIDLSFGGGYYAPLGAIPLPESKASQPEGRVNADLRLLVTVVSTGRVYHGRAADLSSGGMSLYLPVQLDVGERLNLRFSLPLLNSLELNAVIRNRESYRYGIQFIEMDEIQREQIRTVATRVLAYKSGTQ